MNTMKWMLLAIVTAGCSDQKLTVTPCEGREHPGVRAWGGNDLDVLLPDGERTVRAAAQSFAGTQTLELQLTVDGDPWGVTYEDCFLAPAWEGETLHVPMRWTLSSSDGYLDGATGDPLIAEYRDGLMLVGGNQRASRLDWPFGYSSERAREASLTFGEAPGAAAGWHVHIQELYDGTQVGDDAQWFMVYTTGARIDAPQP